MGLTQKSKVMITTLWNMVLNTVLGVMNESDAHCKEGFWRPVCDEGILSQPAGGGIPSTL